MDLAVDHGAPLAYVASSTPVEAEVLQTSAGLILFVTGGRLSCLEYWSTDDELVAELPPPNKIRPAVGR